MERVHSPHRKPFVPDSSLTQTYARIFYWESFSSIVKIAGEETVTRDEFLLDWRFVRDFKATDIGTLVENKQ